jgi:hypothetical protein
VNRETSFPLLVKVASSPWHSLKYTNLYASVLIPNPAPLIRPGFIDMCLLSGSEGASWECRQPLPTEATRTKHGATSTALFSLHLRRQLLSSSLHQPELPSYSSVCLSTTALRPTFAAVSFILLRARLSPRSWTIPGPRGHLRFLDPRYNLSLASYPVPQPHHVDHDDHRRSQTAASARFRTTNKGRTREHAKEHRNAASRRRHQA